MCAPASRHCATASTRCTRRGHSAGRPRAHCPWRRRGARPARAGCGATAGFDPPTDLRYIWTGELDVRGSNGWLRGDLEALLELVRTGSLKPVIDSVVDLAGAIDACRRLEDRAFFGKLVVTP